ncbi:Mobile element protein [Lactococcus lactis subsp. lactis]|nr:Mobile element protein [Lactococcus lactis subsp. lactis]
MNHFKGKQFKKDVIIVAVGYYLGYNLSYREVQEILYDRGINVCHTTIFGRRKIDNPSIHGKWTKPISKLRDVGIICIVQLMRTA